jgi:hypothetical protein
VASVGVSRFALAALALALLAEGDRNRTGSDATDAVRARVDDLWARDRPLLRVPGADRRLARIAPSRATILGTIEPPVTIALCALVFGGRLGPIQLLGAGLVVRPS